MEFITQEIIVENNERRYQPFLKLEDFVWSVLGDTPPKASGENGLMALRICEDALESAEKSQPVKI